MTENEMEDEIYGLHCVIGREVARNRRLTEVVVALLTCMDDEADGRTCPMYDEEAPGRCLLERNIEELGIRGGVG